MTSEPPHGKISTYTNHGCRCDLCRAAMREYEPKSKRPEQRHGKHPYYLDCACTSCVAARRAARNPELPKPLIHGRYSTYTNQGCRCEECKTAAHKAYERRRAKAWAKLAKPIPTSQHGTEAIWRECPCPICFRAYDEFKRAKRRSPSRIPDSLLDQPDNTETE